MDDIDAPVAIALSGLTVAVLGFLSARWGRTRSTVGDDRGDAMRSAYGTARDGGYGVALLGLLVMFGALFARCVAQ